jgi:DNA-binding response OmpR family regulator
MADQNTQKKIMFVDDDSFLLDMYSMKFTKAGYDVKVANSTELALKILRDGYVPNVMLIDIVMPGMDGLDFVSTIRGEKLATGSAIIMLTNQSASDDVARAQKANVDGYIVKATSIPSEVLVEVEKICSSKKS